MNLSDYLTATAPVPAAEATPPAVAAVEDSIWQAAEPVDHLPNGQPLRCTLRRTLIMADVFDACTPPFPAILSIAFLYLCAHPAGTWSAPVTVAPGDVRPLWRAPESLMEAALTWAEQAMPQLTPAECANLATRLWLWHDATRVTPQKKTPAIADPSPTTSAPSPPAISSGSGSPPAATPSAPSGSSIISPFAIYTPPSTAG